MRKLFLLAAIGFLVSCNSGDQPKDESTKKDSTVKQDNDVALPYVATYSSKFEIGDASNMKTILELFKDWDNNSLDNAKSKFSDSISMFFSNGDMMIGSRDSILEQTKGYRNSLGTVTTDVHAIVPLRSNDKNEDWVCVWFTEHRKSAAGKVDSTQMQETWRLKNGKADLVYQYEQKPPKK